MISPPVYTHWIRDNGYNRVERLDNWTNYQIIKRFNNVGTWNLEIPTTAKIASLLNEGSGIIVQRDGVTIFSGYCAEFHATKNTIAMSGFDDMAILRDTPARPTPSQPVGPYPDEYEVSSGVASTVMIQLVNRNRGPGAPSYWALPNLSFDTDPHLGSSIVCRARFDPLLTLLAELASTPIATGLGFDLKQNDNLSPFITFSVYAPQDKRIETVFSTDLHTAQDYEYVWRMPGANYFIVAGGDGFGTERTLVEDGDFTNINEVQRVIASFIDERGTTDLGELNQKLAEALATVVSSRLIQVTPASVPSMKYGVDYDLGDLVTGVVKGISYPLIVREVLINFDPNRGPLVVPTLADPNASQDTTLAQHAAVLEGRISNIERNWNVPNDSIIEDMLHPTMKWYPGDMKPTARSAAQLGWMICDGSAISRTTYIRLFLAIGTTFGAGDGSTTFNIPNTEDKFLFGAGGSTFLGGIAGSYSGTVNAPVPGHAHTHSHGMNAHTHASQAHTHPGKHHHGPNTLVIPHDHQVNIGHTHPSFDTGKRNNDSVGAFGFNEPNVSSGSEDHHHVVNSIVLGTTNITSQGAHLTGGSGGITTDEDGAISAASYTGAAAGPLPAGTEPDANGVDPGYTMNVMPPYLSVNWTIYTGL